ncbi:MAG TPA: DUF5668 domain-containing protein [Acidimicrobiia bacterium]|nr:DUF5668 domain-containing protein [Acidimicrobiia bacterium]
MNWGRLFLGAVIIAVGALLLLDNAGVLDATTVIGDWWPVLVILAGVFTFASNSRHWPVALTLVIVGATMLLSTLGAADLGDVVIPVVVILIGIFILVGRGMGSTVDAGDRINSFNVFSGTEAASHSDRFSGGSVSVLFGGAELDLRDATPADGANLDVFAAFGGVEIRVPQGWQVNIKGFPIFGGFENVTTKDRVAATAPTLVVNATVLFGGLEVKY